jgi:hypothetical protein
MKQLIIATCLMSLFAIGCGRSSKDSDAPSGPAPKTEPTTKPTGEPEETPTTTPDPDLKDPPAGKKDEPKELSCEDQWKKYVDVNNKDDFSKWSMKSESSFNGNVAKTSSISKVTVLSSEDKAVKSKSELEMNGNTYPSEFELTKVQFIDSCKKPAKILEQGAESITVKAGTFDTKWTKTENEVAGNKTTTKSWITTLESGDNLLIKSESETKMPNNNFTKSEMELLETNRD